MSRSLFISWDFPNFLFISVWLNLIDIYLVIFTIHNHMLSLILLVIYISKYKDISKVLDILFLLSVTFYKTYLSNFLKTPI